MDESAIGDVGAAVCECEKNGTINKTKICPSMETPGSWCIFFLFSFFVSVDIVDGMKFLSKRSPTQFSVYHSTGNTSYKFYGIISCSTSIWNVLLD